MNSPNITDFSDSIPLSNLLRHVMPWVPKLPQAMALDLLRQRYINFARRTRILGCRIEQDYQAGVVDYYLMPPDGYSIYSIIGIEGGRYGYYWYGESRVEFKRNFDVIDNNCISLHDSPSVDTPCGLKVFVTLIPESCVTTIPKSIAIPYGKELGNGVIADGLLIPNKEWTNPQLARNFESNYERAILSARALASANRKVGSTEFKPLRIL